MQQPNRKSENRQLRPREPIAVRPACVSQMTCAALVGIDARRFLELVVPRCARVAHVGKLRVVPLDEVERVLAGLSAVANDRESERADDEAPAQPETVDAVLAALGRRRAGAGR